MPIRVEERGDGTRRVSFVFDEANADERSRTKAEFHKDSNINVIMKKYRKTGILGDPLDHREGSYGDFTSGADFAESMRKIARVNDVFAELPAHVRSRFDNSPVQLLDFLVDPKNDPEAIKLGLKVAPKVDPKNDPEAIKLGLKVAPKVVEPPATPPASSPVTPAPGA